MIIFRYQREDPAGAPANLENLMKMLNPTQAMKLQPPRRTNNRSVSVVPTAVSLNLNTSRSGQADMLDQMIRGGGNNV